MGIYPKENPYTEPSAPAMLIPALFTIAKIWNQPKCLLAHEQWYVYPVEYYLAITKKFCNSQQHV